MALQSNPPTLPAQVEQHLIQLGKNINMARLRRGLRMIDLADKVGVSRYLISDIEKGKSTVSIGAYFSAVWALGLAETLNNIASPDQDILGQTLERIKAPKTAGKHKKNLDNEF